MLDTTQVWRDWKPLLNVDHVLQGQGVDCASARGRRPAVVALAERALAEGMPLLEPAVVSRRWRVASVRHERIVLERGEALAGPTVARHLAGAQHIIAILATIGGALDRLIAKTFPIDAAYALALDGLGTAAIEALAMAACGRFSEEAASEGLRSTMPLSPGMVRWPVDVGQPQLFNLLDAESAGVRLTEHCQMVPRRSLSMAIGLGTEVTEGGRACDYCSLQVTCRYQDRYVLTLHDDPVR